ncbi:dipeptide/oligopeptide/nickel ABC transporter ATP-binding protein [Paenibacillus sp. ACRRX]|uniref:ABC transporter ATP-binding protein n=1 Tax=Paenibacillus sp. ACRRX TaxID=2918206 RepID=UPI001EF5025E|nr:dipeptide/oligopeptide/nickel ABC transporter ATP-binding protein [Paenibacillus sp. ACRRX]MCG7407011.1 dipeptide/oligopeptide/nickel ABC transporter ATP-binding protein [Paenibacillus sp. ACRRX]
MNVLLSVNGLSKMYYGSKGKGTIDAIQNISFHIDKGECLGLVGESGCGKSTLAKLLLLLEHPDCGEISFNGSLLKGLKGKALRTMRQHIQGVFQDPNASLNDRLPVWRSVLEPLDNYPEVVPPFLSDIRDSRRKAAARLFEMVGLECACMERYPHELSGGQRQRIVIARGISLLPKLLICDEATTSLDVTVQSQILQLLDQLRLELGLAYLFISHDIAVVEQMSDRILIMQAGKVVDQFAKNKIWSKDRHPYTQLLIAAARS